MRGAISDGRPYRDTNPNSAAPIGGSGNDFVNFSDGNSAPCASRSVIRERPLRQSQPPTQLTMQPMPSTVPPSGLPTPEDEGRDRVARTPIIAAATHGNHDAAADDFAHAERAVAVGDAFGIQAAQARAGDFRQGLRCAPSDVNSVSQSLFNDIAVTQ